MRFQVLALLSVALAPVTRSSTVSPIPVDANCPKDCEPAWYEDTSLTITGPCAAIAFAPGVTTPGTGLSTCETCKTCTGVGCIAWTCNASCGCTYIWEAHAFDRGGNDSQSSGTGSGPQSVTQTVTSACKIVAQQGTLGVSVGGSRLVYRLRCSCQ
jgi:hypothetical protein